VLAHVGSVTRLAGRFGDDKDSGGISPPCAGCCSESDFAVLTMGTKPSLRDPGIK
jgi:hypothetical protein